MLKVVSFTFECYVVHNSQELNSKLLNNQCVDKIFKSHSNDSQDVQPERQI